jgi:hypothetical protein
MARCYKTKGHHSIKLLELQVFYYWHNIWNLVDQIMELRTESDIMGNLGAKRLAIMSNNVTPSVKSKDWAKWSVVLAYSGKKRVKVLDFRHPKGSWFPTDVATTLLQRHEISHKCKVAPFCTTQKRTPLALHKNGFLSYLVQWKFIDHFDKCYSDLISGQLLLCLVLGLASGFWLKKWK